MALAFEVFPRCLTGAREISHRLMPLVGHPDCGEFPGTQYLGEAYRIASVSYGLGGASSLEVLDARRVLRDAESQYTDALAAASMARADLQRAVGAPLERFEAGGPRGQ